MSEKVVNAQRKALKDLQETWRTIAQDKSKEIRSGSRLLSVCMPRGMKALPALRL